MFGHFAKPRAELTSKLQSNLTWESKIPLSAIRQAHGKPGVCRMTLSKVEVPTAYLIKPMCDSVPRNVLGFALER